MNKKSRTYNFAANLLWGVMFSFTTIIINFIVRIVIVNSLGEEINGLQSLFSNMINVMAIIETSASMAMIIHLYKPVQDKEENRIISIMSFYKKIYMFIAISFAALCIVIDVFFLENMLTSTISNKKIHLYFIMFSLSFVINYITYYPKCLLYAEQKNRIISIVNLFSEMFFRCTQIVVVILWKKYYLYLILMILEKAFSNVLCYCYVRKYHPTIKEIKNNNLEKEEKKKIINSMKPIAVSQSSSAIYNSSKPILISLLLGNISIVGYYGNYQLIVSAVETLFSQFGAAFTSGFGNLISDEKEKKNAVNVYEKSLFSVGWISILFCVGFFCCIQPFIKMSFGSSFVIASSCVFVIMINLFITLISVPIISVQNAMGLHKIDQYMMVLQSIVGIVLGYFGGVKFGMIGILSGSFLSYLLFTFIIKGCLVYSKAFAKSGKIYLFSAVKYTLYLLIVFAISAVLINYINLSNAFFQLIINGVVVVVSWLLSFVLLSYKSEHFKGIINLVNRVLRRKKNEKENSVCIK